MTEERIPKLILELMPLCKRKTLIPLNKELRKYLKRKHTTDEDCLNIEVWRKIIKLN